MAKGIERNIIPYELKYQGRNGKTKTRRLNIRIFSNKPLLAVADTDVPAIEIPGYAQGRRVLKDAVRRRAEEEGIYAVGVHLPLLRLPRRKEAIEAALTDIPRFVAARLRGDSQEKVFGIGQSMGASALALAGAAASENPATNPLGDMLLLQPAVMQPVAKELVETTGIRNKIALFKARWSYALRFVGNDAPLRVRGDLKATYDNWKTLIDAAARNVYDMVTRRSKVQFNFAVTHSTSEAIKHYIDNTGSQVVIPLGAQDPVSTRIDAITGLIAAGAQPNNPTVIVVDNVVHTTPHLPQGRELIRQGLEVLAAKGHPVKRYERRPAVQPKRRLLRRRHG